jgi:hypothetical protein
MPTIRQTLLANLTRLYPFYSGCSTLANKPFIQKIVGNLIGHDFLAVPEGDSYENITKLVKAVI